VRGLKLDRGREDIKDIIGYYSLLFTFPSRGLLVGATVALTVFSSGLAYSIAYGLGSIQDGLNYGLLGLALPIVISDLIVGVFLRGDHVLTARRINIASFCWGIAYSFIVMISSIVVWLTGDAELLARGVLMSLTLNVAMRLLVFPMFSDKGWSIRMPSALVQPATCILGGFVLVPSLSNLLSFSGLIAIAIVVIGLSLFNIVMRLWREDDSGLRLVPLFRAFLMAWAEKHSQPLEEEITGVAVYKDLDVDMVKFIGDDGRCLVNVVVPYIHPGPFLNVGSSAISKVITDRLSASGCTTMVCHGVSTHDLDMTRSSDLEKIVESIHASKSTGSGSKCTPMTRADVEGAKASCQLFNSTAFFTLTMAPKSHDDIPVSVLSRIRNDLTGEGVKAVVVDAHNSLLEEDLLTDTDAENLHNASMEAFRKARGEEQRNFSIAAATVIPNEWRLDEGVGPCGISALLVRLETGETYAYLCFDSNNMATGLRERLLDVIREEGCIDGEALTSDTHLVNGIGATDRGYYPIGERTDWGSLTEYVRGVIRSASSKLTSAHASFSSAVVPNIPVIGEDGLKTFRHVLDSGFSFFKRTALSILPVTIVLAAVAVYML